MSQEASAFYNKMMAKYNSMPDEPKIFSNAKKNINTNLSGTKDRVKAALLKEQEEATLPHRRKRKTKESSHDSHDEDKPERSYEDDEPVEEKPKPRPKPRPAPPPMNFQELLKIAEKKQFEPIIIEPKKKPEEEEHPMTKKQKREFEKERLWKEQREQRRLQMEGDRKMGPPSNKIPKLTNDAAKTSKTEDRSSNNNNINNKSSQKPDRKYLEEKQNISNTKKSSEDRIKIPDKSQYPVKKPVEKISSDNKPSKLRAELEKRDDHRIQNQNHRNYYPNASNNQQKSSSSSSSSNNSSNYPQKSYNSSSSGNSKMLERSSKEPYRNGEAVRKNIPSDKYPSSANPKLPEKNKSDIVNKPKQLHPPTDVRKSSDMRDRKMIPDRPKQFPPTDMKPKQFPPPDVRRKQFPPDDIRRKLSKKPLVNKRKYFYY